MQMPISSDEWELLRQIEHEPVGSDTLDDRQQVLARRMLSRGLLDHYQRDHQTFYRVSNINDIWRDRDDS